MNDSLDKKIHHRNAVARAHSQAARGQTSMLMVKEEPAYTGRALEIFPIVLVNIVLTFLTVGIYRFWAKTRIRRYFVSRISFLGDPLEYSGTGMELFIGFLIVLVILVPVFVATGIARYFLERPGTDPMSVVVFEVGYFLVLYFLFNVAVYRAQRYRLSRINWRGIRGGQEGSALLYALLALVHGLVSIATLGLAYPVMRRVLLGFRLNHASFGTERFIFRGGFAALIGAWLGMWALGLALLAVFSYPVWLEILPHLKESVPDFGIRKVAVTALQQNWMYPLSFVFVIPFLFIWYRTFETRLLINNTNFTGLAFVSRLRAFHLIVPYLAYLLLILAAACGAYFGTSALIGRSVYMTGDVGIDRFLPIGTAVVTLWIAGGLLYPIIVQNWFMEYICRTLSVQGRFSPDTLFQNQLDIPRRGEGLADALDVDAF